MFVGYNTTSRPLQAVLVIQINLNLLTTTKSLNRFREE